MVKGGTDPDKWLIKREEFNAVCKPLPELDSTDSKGLRFLDAELEKKTMDILTKVNVLRDKFGADLAQVKNGMATPTKVVMSPILSYNPANKDAEIAHASCEAIDFADPGHRLRNWIFLNLSFLQDNGLWMMHPKYTPNHVHLQSYPPAWSKGEDGKADLVFDITDARTHYTHAPITARKLIADTDPFTGQIDPSTKELLTGEAIWEDITKMNPIIIQDIINFREWTRSATAREIAPNIPAGGIPIVIHFHGAWQAGEGHTANSRHYYGEALDFHLDGFSKGAFAKAILLMEAWIKQTGWVGGLGKYPTWPSNPGFHMDCGPHGRF